MLRSNSIDMIRRMEAAGEVQVWWSDGQPHREHGPAILYSNGTHEEWLRHGNYHRIGGPSVIGHIGGTPYLWWYIRHVRMRNWKQYQKFSKCSDSDIIFLRLKWGDTGMVN